MKKLIAIIIVLVIIYVSLFVYKKIEIEKEKQNYISAEEVIKIETYIEKIYMWQEITNEALPEFENQNEIDELWLWNVIGKNIIDKEITYQSIDDKKIELFGENLEKEFPKEGGFYYIYNEQEDVYTIEGISLDAQNDVFLINNIEKEENAYIVEIVEYLEDYDVTKQGDEEQKVYIKNTKREIIGKVNQSDLKNEGKNIVKENIERFQKKRLVLEMEEDRLYIVSVINI